MALIWLDLYVKWLLEVADVIPLSFHFWKTDLKSDSIRWSQPDRIEWILLRAVRFDATRSKFTGNDRIWSKCYWLRVNYSNLIDWVQLGLNQVVLDWLLKSFFILFNSMQLGRNSSVTIECNQNGVNYESTTPIQLTGLSLIWIKSFWIGCWSRFLNFI